MRRTKLLMTTAVMMAAMMMSGCGEEAYALTDKEEELIVNYSAHVVTKYNTYQKEGLTYVWPEETEEVETETPVAGDDAIEEDTAQTESGQVVSEGGTTADVPDDTATNDDTAYVSNVVTLDELFGVPGVELDYVGARLADSYVEDEYYALYPNSGKQYLVLGIDITNEGDEPVDIDYLTDTAEFQVVLNGEVTASSELTVLLQDFSTFEATLKAGETRETVLLFQVPTTVTSVEKVELVVAADENYQIILENE